MRTKTTRFTALALSLMLAFSLTGCGSDVNEKNVATYVQGNLDTYYKGVCSDDYLKLMDYSTAKITETYQKGLDTEFKYMAEIFYIETDWISEELYNEGIELLDAVYSHSQYTVKDPVKNDEGTYMVEVAVDPVDVFAQVYDGDAILDFMDEFSAQYTQDQIDAMTDEEYAAYEDAWARGVFDLCWEAEKNPGYTETETTVLQVKPDDDGYYTLVDADFETFDYMVLAYTTEE